MKLPIAAFLAAAMAFSFSAEAQQGVRQPSPRLTARPSPPAPTPSRPTRTPSPTVTPVPSPSLPAGSIPANGRLTGCVSETSFSLSDMSAVITMVQVKYANGRAEDTLLFREDGIELHFGGTLYGLSPAAQARWAPTVATLQLAADGKHPVKLMVSPSTGRVQDLVVEWSQATC
jgi:hypothetical protein